MKSNLNKIDNAIYFALLSDQIGVYVTIVDKNSRLISEIDDDNLYNENDLKIIELIREINNDSFFSGWSNGKNELYIDENIEVLEYIKNSNRVVNEEMLPIKWSLYGNKIILKIEDIKDEKFCKSKLLLNGKEDF